MFTYVVGFIDFFDNDLKMVKIRADNAVEALLTSGFLDGYEFPEDATVDDIKREMFNCDAAISIICI